VAFGLLRLKSCPQGQLNDPHYPFSDPQQATACCPAAVRRSCVGVKDPNWRNETLLWSYDK